MIFSGHIGIPLAVAKISQKRICKPDLIKFIKSIDYRVFLVGALLPDLIDKPLSIFLGNAIGTSQSYGHTLIFSTIMLLSGLFLYKKYDIRLLLTLAIGILFHQALDLPTMHYKNFFWPLYGFKLIPSDHFESNLIKRLLNDISSPYYLTGEIIGLPITIYYFAKVCIERKLNDFIKFGKIEI